jgi:hypothetical protein
VRNGVWWGVIGCDKVLRCVTACEGCVGVAGCDRMQLGLEAGRGVVG